MLQTLQTSYSNVTIMLQSAKRLKKRGTQRTIKGVGARLG